MIHACFCRAAQAPKDTQIMDYAPSTFAFYWAAAGKAHRCAIWTALVVLHASRIRWKLTSILCCCHAFFCWYQHLLLLEPNQSVHGVTCACGGRAFGESIRPCHANCSDEAGRGLRPVRQCMNETCYPAAIKADMQVGKGTGRNQYPIKSVLPLGIQGCQYACHYTPRIEDCT